MQTDENPHWLYLAVLLLCSPGVLAAQVSDLPPATSSADVAGRLNQLEAETQSLAGGSAVAARASGSLAGGRRHAHRHGVADRSRPRPPRLPDPERVLHPRRASRRDEEVRLEEGRFHHRSLRNPLGQHGLFHRTHLRPARYTLYVQSASTEPESEFIVDARNTRLGFDVAGPPIPFFNCAQSGGKVEIDFQQQRALDREQGRPSCCGTPMPK